MPALLGRPGVLVHFLRTRAGTRARTGAHRGTSGRTDRLRAHRRRRASRRQARRRPGLGDAGREPVDRPASLPAAAVRVLDDERIDLLDSARWDIHRGEIDERLLTTMADMAELFPYAVCCLKSGHPINVGFSG